MQSICKCDSGFLFNSEPDGVLHRRYKHGTQRLVEINSQTAVCL